MIKSEESWLDHFRKTLPKEKGEFPHKEKEGNQAFFQTYQEIKAFRVALQAAQNKEAVHFAHFCLAMHIPQPPPLEEVERQFKLWKKDNQESSKNA